MTTSLAFLTPFRKQFRSTFWLQSLLLLLLTKRNSETSEKKWWMIVVKTEIVLGSGAGLYYNTFNLLCSCQPKPGRSWDSHGCSSNEFKSALIFGYHFQKLIVKLSVWPLEEPLFIPCTTPDSKYPFIVEFMFSYQLILYSHKFIVIFVYVNLTIFSQ